MRNAGLEEAQAGIKIAGRNISNLRYADDTKPMAEDEEQLKRLEETQAGIKIAGRNISHLRYADDTTLMAESEEEQKSPLMKAPPLQRRVKKLA